MDKIKLKPRYKGPITQKFKQRSETDRVGYVPVEDRISALLKAGKTLQRSRAELYDMTQPEGQVEMRLRAKDIDMADVSELQRYTAQRRIEINEHLRQKKIDKARKALAAQQREQGQGVKPLAGVGGQSPAPGANPNPVTDQVR